MTAKLLTLTLLLGAGCGSSRATPTDGGTTTPPTDAAAATDGAPSPDAGPAMPGSGRYFPAGSVYYRDISGVTPAPNSAAITAQMERVHAPNGWGGGGRMRIDFSIVTLEAPAGTAKRAHIPVADYYWPPDCDSAPVPLPSGGASEGIFSRGTTFNGLAGYDCDGFDDGADCHIIVFAPAEQRLYEIYHGTLRANGSFEAGCLAVWDTSSAVTAAGRGTQCTSADAAGYAIAPLLVTPEEVQAGEIRHPVRLILPNDIIRRGSYFAPATHGTSTSGGADTLPYGGSLRLRADYPVGNLSPAARVVARAMQRYGLMLADGGQIAITMQSDVFSAVSWASVGLTTSSLSMLRASDFEAIVEGSAITTGATDCNRRQITQ